MASGEHESAGDRVDCIKRGRRPKPTPQLDNKKPYDYLFVGDGLPRAVTGSPVEPEKPHAAARTGLLHTCNCHD